MTEFTTLPADAEHIVTIGNAELLFNYGKFDKKCLVIKYRKQIKWNKSKIVYWPLYDYELYRSYMKSVSIYSGHQKEWDELNFDIFNVEVNSEFDSEMKRVIMGHGRIVSAFLRMPSENDFSRVWKPGLPNIYGILCSARLVGEARDYKYQSYENPTDSRIPISACIGRNGTKDCLYKINKGIYADFYRIERIGVDGIYQTHEWDGKHYNISEILKYETIPELDLEYVNFMHNMWAARLDNWYKRFLEPYSTARSRVLKFAKKSIYDSLLSNKNKDYEIMKLDKYEMYIR